MRRRIREDPADVIPLWLRRYRAEDWPEAACHPECAWWAAARQWRDQNPGSSLPMEAMPDAPFHPELI